MDSTGSDTEMNTLSGGDASRSPDNEDSRLETGRKIDAPSPPTQQAIEAASAVVKHCALRRMLPNEFTIAEIIQAAIDAAVAADREEAAEHHRKEQEELNAAIDEIWRRKK